METPEIPPATQKPSPKKIRLSLALALGVVMMAVSALVSVVATKAVLYDDSVGTSCTQVGAYDSIWVDLSAKDLEGAESVVLSAELGGPDNVTTMSTTLTEEDLAESDADEVSISLWLAHEAMQGQISVTLEIHRADGEPLTYTLHNPDVTPFSPNGPDCDPHVLVTNLMVKDGELVNSPQTD